MIVHCFRSLEDNDGLKTFLQGIMKDKNLTDLNNLAKRFMMDYYSGQKDYPNALSIADELLTAKTDTMFLCDVLYAKGLIHSHDLNEPSKAIDYFSIIVNDYSDNILAGMAVNELRLLGYEVPKISKQTTASTKTYELAMNSHPNPFNPSTTIKYQLPENGKVSMRVYDLLGREVAALVNEIKDAGSYSVIFDGSRLASGFYFVRVQFESRNGRMLTQTLKVQMLK
jgi:hypothetical protein